MGSKGLQTTPKYICSNPELSDRNHVCNLKFSGSHSLKNENEQAKLILIIDFT